MPNPTPTPRQKKPKFYWILCSHNGMPQTAYLCEDEAKEVLNETASHGCRYKIVKVQEVSE